MPCDQHTTHSIAVPCVWASPDINAHSLVDAPNAGKYMDNTDLTHTWETT